MKRKIGEFIKEYSVRNTADEDIPVYSVTNENGFCTGYFSKDVSSKDRTTYKIVPRGCFAYNPSRINVGSIDCQNCEDRVIVSPLYVVFEVSDELDKQYLLHYLKSDVANAFIRANGAGSVRDNLRFRALSDIPIQMVPVEEQREIVKKIDNISGLIGKGEMIIEELDHLVKSRFVEMFGDPVHNEKGWDKMPIEEICQSIADCPHSTPNYTNEDTGYMCIRTSIVKKNRILWDEVEFISEEEYIQRIQRKKPEKGDVIYTREGAILGIAAIIDRDYNVALGQRSMLLSPNRKYCTPEFLSVAMNFDSFLESALKGMSGSASPHINVGDIKAFKMIIPPIESQESFSGFMQQTDKSKHFDDLEVAA